jgi:hypothetical protein
MPHIASELPPRYQRRALTDLDGLIARAESDAQQRLLAVERSPPAGKDATCLRARLRFATDCLALLRMSPGCLLSGGPPPEVDERH